MNIDLLGICAGRQHDVGALSRVGHECVVYRDEEIFAREALPNQVLIGRGGCSVGVVHVESLYVVTRRERVAQFDHVVVARPGCSQFCVTNVV